MIYTSVCITFVFLPGNDQSNYKNKNKTKTNLIIKINSKFAQKLSLLIIKNIMNSKPSNPIPNLFYLLFFSWSFSNPGENFKTPNGQWQNTIELFNPWSNLRKSRKESKKLYQTKKKKKKQTNIRLYWLKALLTNASLIFCLIVQT